MTTQDLTVSHAHGAEFQRGLRSFFGYRDLGINGLPMGGSSGLIPRLGRWTTAPRSATIRSDRDVTLGGLIHMERQP